MVFHLARVSFIIAQLSNFSEMQNRRLNLLNFFQPPNYNFQFTHQGHFMQRQRNDPRMNVRRENTSNDNLVHNHGYFYYQTDDVHGRAVRQSLRSVPHGQHKSPIALLQEEHEVRLGVAIVSIYPAFDLTCSPYSNFF
jgi:hypothetical protein